WPADSIYSTVEYWVNESDQRYKADETTANALISSSSAREMHTWFGASTESRTLLRPEDSTRRVIPSRKSSRRSFSVSTPGSIVRRISSPGRRIRVSLPMLEVPFRWGGDVPVTAEH